MIVGVCRVSGVLGHLAEDPNTLQEAFVATNSQRMESLTYVAPIAYSIDWLIYFSDKSKVLTLGIVSCMGVIVGSALHALATRNFRWEGFRNAEDTANHLVGGVLMGVGGVTAMGCTIGQGLSGLSTLDLSLFIALSAIVAGAVAAFRSTRSGASKAWREPSPPHSEPDPLAADPRTSFGGLRRLYGTDAYERIPRRARVAVVGIGGVDRGPRKRWRAAASRNWC